MVVCYVFEERWAFECLNLCLNIVRGMYVFGYSILCCSQSHYILLTLLSSMQALRQEYFTLVPPPSLLPTTSNSYLHCCLPMPHYWKESSPRTSQVPLVESSVCTLRELRSYEKLKDYRKPMGTLELHSCDFSMHWALGIVYNWLRFWLEDCALRMRMTAVLMEWWPMASCLPALYQCVSSFLFCVCHLAQHIELRVAVVCSWLFICCYLT